MKKGCSIKEEPEDQVIAESYSARQVEEDMTVKEQMHSMQQDFNKKHDDLLARLDSLSALISKIDVLMLKIHHQITTKKKSSRSVRKKTPKRSVICTTCSRKFGTENALKSHSKDKHGST